MVTKTLRTRKRLNASSERIKKLRMRMPAVPEVDAMPLSRWMSIKYVSRAKPIAKNRPDQGKAGGFVLAESLWVVVEVVALGLSTGGFDVSILLSITEAMLSVAAWKVSGNDIAVRAREIMSNEGFILFSAGANLFRRSRTTKWNRITPITTETKRSPTGKSSISLVKGTQLPFASFCEIVS